MNIHAAPFRTVVIGLAVGLLCAAGAAAQGYTIRDIGTIGGFTSEAFGINNFGQVVGAGTVADGNLRGLFRDASGALTPIPALPGDLQSYAYSVNASGQVAGASFDIGEVVPRGLIWESGNAHGLGAISPHSINAVGAVVGYLVTNLAGFGWVDHAALAQEGSIIDLGTLGGHWSYATAIADDGRIVGMSFLSDDVRHRATLWLAGVPSDLGTLGGNNSYAYGINALGSVVGVADTVAGQPHAFLFTLDGAGNVIARQDLGVLGGGYSYAYGVNNDNVVVGGSNAVAFVWKNGVMSDLNTLVPASNDWRLDLARAVNDNGQIVGVGLHHGQPRAFLATPAVTADANCDGVVDFADIDPFVAALSGEAAYNLVVPECRWLNCDANHDGVVDFADIDPFVACLGGNCP